ncbi:DMT family transporter [Oceaniglobus ichthyenteri]|uniref:DMT family transporter n=1 Tax=Oceaniglobus ichthyenteri TaxID=2136177 RepID=UPI000D3C0B37|nr:DMT family transporter [Oceaniglobus ichthyenteri]
MSPLRAILFKVGSVVLFVLMSALIKLASEDVPAGQAVFFRSFFAIPVILTWLLWRHELRTGLRTVVPLGHVWRGLVGTTSMGLGFAGLAYLPLAEAQAIQYTAPLLVVIFAAMFLGEEVRAFRLTAVALGMTGVLIVLSPRLTTLSTGGVADTDALGALLVLMAAVFAALAQVFVRKLVRTEQTSAIVFWFSVTASVLALTTIPFGWVMPGVPVLVMLVSAGLVGGLAQILLTTSYRLADVSVVAPFEYSSMLLTVAIGYWVFDDVPTLTMLFGVALVIAAGVLIIWRERALGLERRQGRKAVPPQ